MPTYTFRRELKAADWARAIGIGAGVGIGAAVATTYLARIFLQRAPLREPPPILVERGSPANRR